MNDIYKILKDLGISFKEYNHPAVFTVEEALLHKGIRVAKVRKRPPDKGSGATQQGGNDEHCLGRRSGANRDQSQPVQLFQLVPPYLSGQGCRRSPADSGTKPHGG